ncbi:hypothetical protein PYCCODRAFT_968895 [Trametes coccinea BRFM310]|uniref:Uncharacterized protein n=1 Tax=Trametes coccinea (strain BRFM310) TaxID=1353009 RepID=A0A1Y2IDZ4_TRAC3|nr:hypothetical protein PYCCODRAFT_968895 [Trametes coccinea BRFM310]
MRAVVCVCCGRRAPSSVLRLQPGPVARVVRVLAVLELEREPGEREHKRGRVTISFDSESLSNARGHTHPESRHPADKAPPPFPLLASRPTPPPPPLTAMNPPLPWPGPCARSPRHALPRTHKKVSLAPLAGYLARLLSLLSSYIRSPPAASPGSSTLLCHHWALATLHARSTSRFHPRRPRPLSLVGHTCCSS